MKILFYEVQEHFSPNFHEFIQKQYLPFLAQKLENKKNLSKSVSGYYKTIKKI